MLLRFAVSNFRSLRDRQELSFVASTLDDNASDLIDAPQVPGRKLLPVLAVYGPNASGKSNLVGAIQWMRAIVLYSHSRGEPGGAIPTQPFSLDPSRADAPSRCDIDFVTNGIRYHYGFDASRNVFDAEWLYSFPHDRKQVLFERNGMAFIFGRALRGRNQTIAGLTRPNSLFLAAAAQNGHEELASVVSFFRDIVVGEAADHEIAETLANPGTDRRIVEFLKIAGTGVVGYRVRDIHLDVEQNQLVTTLHGIIANQLKDTDLNFPDYRKELQLAHPGINGEHVFFQLHNESLGTRRLLRILIPAFKALDTAGSLVIDELDASLHTKACELVLALFSQSATNPKGAQLLLTTHDTNLLYSAHLRRDQVWLTEKDPKGATTLYPLTDFRTRKTDNLERGYLQGRYGAVPFAGEARDIALAI
jgi:hypothetical protein